MSDEINGVDTIGGLRTPPPQEIGLSFDLIYTQELLRSNWNTCYVAVLPYCFNCKEPLVWHTKPTDGILFHCPKCNRKWKQDKNWKKDTEAKCR